MNPFKPGGYFMGHHVLHVLLTERIYDLLGSPNKQQLRLRALFDWFV
jgi:hypothetical protein